MNWLYLFLTSMIGLTECQTLVSYSECSMVDQLLLKTFEEKKKLEIELSNLRRHVDHLHRDLVHLEKLFKSILIQSKCRPFTFGLKCETCPCNKTTTEVCDYETGSCKCKPGFQGKHCDCVIGQHKCNLTSSYCSYNNVDGSPTCICRDGFEMASGCQEKHMVRLVGGGFMSGRLEVKIDGEWGTVCDDYFGTDDANVVCKQLGYSSGVVRDQAYYGMGSLKILMDDVACLGSELAIQNCRYKREHDCSHSEDVGVICS